MGSKLISNLHTKEDLDILQGELDILQNALYQTNNKYEDILKSVIRKWVSEIILSETKNLPLSDYIKAVRKELEKVSVISIATAFEPSESFTERVSQTLAKFSGQALICEYYYNPHLIGGVQISLKGKYLDLSLRKKIASEFENLSLQTNVTAVSKDEKKDQI